MIKKKILSVCLALVMALGVIVSAIPAVSAAGTMSFKDVKTTDWFYEYVKYVFERDLMKGTSNTTFGPDESMTRGQIVTILSRMSGDDVVGMSSEMNFKDVNKAEYYADPIGWAVKNGIAKGMTATTFEPETPVLRQEFAAFFVRYMNYKGITLPDAGKVTPFPDKATFPDWATDNIETLQKTGLVKGDAKGNYNPASKMTRAEIATVTMRFTESVEAHQGEVPPDLPTDETIEEFIDEVLEELKCIVHNTVNLQFGAAASLTEENFNAVLVEIFGLPEDYEITVDPFDLESVLSDYQGEGSGDTVGLDAEITFRNKTTGFETTRDIHFGITKDLPCYRTGAVEAGALSLCWDDVPDNIKSALRSIKDVNDEITTEIADFTEAGVEAYFRALTGLTDAEQFVFYIAGFDPAQAEEGCYISFTFKTVIDGAVYGVGSEAFLKPTP